MKITVDKNGSPRYFTAKLGWKEQFDPKEIEMLSAGVVPMLISPESVLGRKNNVIRFDITPYTTLDFYLTCILSREQFVELLEQFTELFRQMQTVYLNYKNLALELSQVYITLKDRSLHLVYLPLRDSRREASIPDFFRKLAQTVNRSTYEQVTFVEGLLAFLDRPAPFTLGGLTQFIREMTAVAVPAGQAAAPAAAAAQPEQPVYVPVRPAPAPVEPKACAPVADPGGTVLLEPQGGTVLLGEDVLPAPRGALLRAKTGERIELCRPVFRIGKEVGQVDYCITDNPAVSRAHAEILCREGAFLVRDLNSTNKTYLNGCALTPGEETPLEPEAVLRLGNEEFRFVQEG